MAANTVPSDPLTRGVRSTGEPPSAVQRAPGRERTGPSAPKTPNLASAGLAIILLISILLGGLAFARYQEGRYINALTSRMFHQKVRGSAVQREALNHPDLLPFFGSSELYSSENTPYNARNLFSSYPSGFTIFPVGDVSVNSLLTAEELAAAGGDLRGKKIVISISPVFFSPRGLPADQYSGNFSLLHATELLFSTDVSFDLKRDAAREMLRYPDTLSKDALVDFAARRLTGGSPVDAALYYAEVPLGKLRTLVLRLQDHWEMLAYIAARPELSTAQPIRSQATLDWASIQTQAEKAYRRHADNNPYGIENQHWLDMVKEGRQTPGASIGSAPIDVNGSPEWASLEILLRELHEVGAKPLLISLPIAGGFNDHGGMRPSVRAAYYERIRQTGNAYAIPVVTFESHDEDPYFLMDPVSHPSEKGWSFIDQAVDDFYHDRLTFPSPEQLGVPE